VIKSLDIRELHVVAVGAHQDDVELTCGGTLARYRRERRCTIAIVCVSAGDMGGTSAAGPARSTTAAVRELEAREAAARIGAAYHCLGQPDGFVENSAGAKAELAAILRAQRADIVLAPPPADYHPDHRATSALVSDACLLASVPALAADGEPLARAPALFYTDSIAGLDFVPTRYVDITETFADKQELLRLHRSQMAHMRAVAGWDLVEYSQIVGAFRGLQCGVRYAEGFRPALEWPRLRPDCLPAVGQDETPKAGS
jgi:LmbE family N-acetylglucosaminyl deacetylase